MKIDASADLHANADLPRIIRMHPNDNVAIIVNDFGLPAGTDLPAGPTLRERVPQGHKVALVDIAEGAPVYRYNVVIGYAGQALPAGSWVNEQRLVMPTPPACGSVKMQYGTIRFSVVRFFPCVRFVSII